MAKEIRDELGDVWAKWYEIGVGLKLSTATLDTLEEGSPEDKMLVRYFGGWVYYLGHLSNELPFFCLPLSNALLHSL